MKTIVKMERLLFGSVVHQRSDNQFLSMTDLIKVGNKWRAENKLPLFDYKNYFRTQNTIEFCNELKLNYGVIKISGRGRGHHTWLHPILWIDIALAISPQLKVKTYEWLFDNLIKYRNDSGDSYRKMAGALYDRSKCQSKFHLEISGIALQIQAKCGVDDWQNATQDQLHSRDIIHSNVAVLTSVVKSNEQAVRIALEYQFK